MQMETVKRQTLGWRSAVIFSMIIRFFFLGIVSSGRYICGKVTCSHLASDREAKQVCFAQTGPNGSRTERRVCDFWDHLENVLLTYMFQCPFGAVLNREPHTNLTQRLSLFLRKWEENMSANPLPLSAQGKGKKTTPWLVKVLNIGCRWAKIAQQF